MSSWRLGACDGAEPDEALIIPTSVGTTPIFHGCAHQCRQLLGVAVNAVASAAPAADLGDDAVVLAAAIATAKAQVEPSTSSSLPILPRPGGWRSSGAPTLLQVPPKRRSDAQRGRRRLASALSCFVIIVASCATIELSNLRARHLADSPLPWLARTLLMAQARSLWRDASSRGATRPRVVGGCGLRGGARAFACLSVCACAYLAYRNAHVRCR